MAALKEGPALLETKIIKDQVNQIGVGHQARARVVG